MKTYEELVRVLKTDIIPNAKLNEKTRKTIAQLQSELDKNFRPFYEYELLRLVLKNYNFFFTDKNDSNVDESKSSRFYKLMQNLPFRRNRFGEIQFDRALIPPTDVFNSTVQSVNGDFRIQCNPTDYVFNDGPRVIKKCPFSSMQCMQFIYHLYLYNKHQKYHNRSNNAEEFEFFPVLQNETYIGTYNNRFVFKSERFKTAIVKHFQRTNNCFTMFSGGTLKHTMPVLMHKNATDDTINIIIIDNNHTPATGVRDFISMIEIFFQDSFPDTKCKSRYIHGYRLNFGKSSKYEEAGYCQLVTYLFMDILFTNIVVHKHLKADASIEYIIRYVQLLQKFLYENYVRSDTWKLLCFNYCYKILDEMSVFSQDQVINPSHFAALGLMQIQEEHDNEINQRFNFGQKLCEIMIANDFMPLLVGISLVPIGLMRPQRENSYVYYVPQALKYKHHAEAFYFKGVTDEFHKFIVRNDYEYVQEIKHDETDPMFTRDFTDIKFLFYKMNDHFRELYTRTVRNELNYPNDSTPTRYDPNTTDSYQFIKQSLYEYTESPSQDPRNSEIFKKLMKHIEIVIQTQCSIHDRDKKWYEVAVRLLKKTQDLIIDSYGTSHYDILFPVLSYYANCVINNNNSVMTMHDLGVAEQKIRDDTFTQRTGLPDISRKTFHYVLKQIKQYIHHTQTPSIHHESYNKNPPSRYDPNTVDFYDYIQNSLYDYSRVSFKDPKIL